MLSQELKNKLTTVSTNTMALDYSSKDLFIIAYNEYMKESKDLHTSLTKDLNAYLDETIASTAVKASIKRIFNVSRKYVELDVITHLDSMTFESIKQVVSLLSYLYKNKAEVAKSQRNKLARVKVTTNVEYNNKLQHKCKEIKESFSINEVDGELKVMSSNVMYTNLSKSLDSYTTKEIQKLLELVQSKLTIEEVA